MLEYLGEGAMEHSTALVYRSPFGGSYEREHADLRAPFARQGMKADAGAFREIGHPGLFEHGAVQEHLLAATVRRDEAKALLCIVPLDDSQALRPAGGSLIRRRTRQTLLLLLGSQEPVERISKYERLI